MNDYPRILISGQYFHRRSGGGITLSNLFYGWDKSKIAAFAASINDPDFDVCNSYFQLGSNDFTLRYPFNLKRQRNIDYSGVIVHRGKDNSSPKIPDSKKSFLRLFHEKILFTTGLIHYRSKFTPGQKFLNWVGEYRPEILYSQLSTLDEIRNVAKLQALLNIPLAVHIMDDWPSTICARYFPKFIWKRIIDRELRSLFSNAKVLLSISEPMSEEYYRRYGLTFIPFHNPIDTKKWLPFSKTDFSLNKRNITVLYSGRIGIGISDSLLDVAEAIEKMNAEGQDKRINLHIQTSMPEHNIISKLQKYSCVNINPIAKYEEIPRIFSQADILLLANDFKPEAVKFLKYSMPTKASEYMISGTPILVYSDAETAVTKFFIHHGCGHCIKNQSMYELIIAINMLIDDTKYRELLGKRAIKLALEKFDSVSVREEFLKILKSTLN